jgi:TatD DNase family protein
MPVAPQRCRKARAVPPRATREEQALPELIDIGINLAHDSFDHDRAEVLERARASGVGRMVVTGSSEASSALALELAESSAAGLFATAGVHPHHANEYSAETSNALRQLASHPRVVAVGECGLDFFRNFSPVADQERAFRAQLELAAELRMPVFLHQRDAHDRFLAILDEYLSDLTAAVAHCFTEGPAARDDYLERGLYLGITGWVCDERRGHDLRDAVTGIPEERIMIETDAPYLLPRDLEPRPRTRRNEPMHLPHVLATIARLRGDDPAVLAAATTANAERFFGLS